MNWRAVLERLRAAVFPDAEAAAIVDAAERMTVDGLSRRAFLRAGLLAATVAATVDVEQLLWTPGEKTLFLPAVEDVAIYDGLLTPDWITREALRILKNNLQFAGRMTRDYRRRFDRRDYRMGDTVQVPLPVRFSAIVESFDDVPLCLPTRPVILDQQRACLVNMPTAADARDPQHYLRREVEPAMQRMAAELDRARVDVFADLPLPRDAGVIGARVASSEGGPSVRGLHYYDIVDNMTRMRLDVLGGSSAPRRKRRA